MYTNRLQLRAWRLDDADDLYNHAKTQNVGPVAGWEPDTSVENSRQIIRDILMKQDSFAIVLRTSGEVIGSIGLHMPVSKEVRAKCSELELGYWLGEAYWGRGLMMEAAQCLLTEIFINRELDVCWCGYFEGNEKSKRLQERLGFTYHHTEILPHLILHGESIVEHFTQLTRSDYIAIYQD